MKIYLPVVNWVYGEEIRPLDYEEDILFRIDWSQIDLDGIMERIPTTAQELETQRIQIGLSDYESVDFLATRDLGREQIEKLFDPVYAVRAIVDIVPNPWVAREIIAVILDNLKENGIADEKLGAVGHLVIDTLRAQLGSERDRLAESLFMDGVKSGLIQFRLRTDNHNWVMPEETVTQRDAIARNCAE